MSRCFLLTNIFPSYDAGQERSLEQTWLVSIPRCVPFFLFYRMVLSNNIILFTNGVYYFVIRRKEFSADQKYCCFLLEEVYATCWQKHRPKWNVTAAIFENQFFCGGAAELHINELLPVMCFHMYKPSSAGKNICSFPLCPFVIVQVFGHVWWRGYADVQIPQSLIGLKFLNR